MASGPLAISPLASATATAVRPEARWVRVIRWQASSPDCRIASASMPGGALRVTNRRWAALAWGRSWLVLGAVGRAVDRLGPRVGVAVAGVVVPDRLGPGAAAEPAAEPAAPVGAVLRPTVPVVSPAVVVGGAVAAVLAAVVAGVPAAVVGWSWPPPQAARTSASSAVPSPAAVA